MKIVVCFANSLTEKTTLNIRTILPSNFSRFSSLLLRSTVKNGIDQHEEAEFP